MLLSGVCSCSLYQDGSGRQCLLIERVVKADAGWYTLSAINEAGMSTCNARLDVGSKWARKQTPGKEWSVFPAAWWLPWQHNAVSDAADGGRVQQLPRHKPQRTPIRRRPGESDALRFQLDQMTPSALWRSAGDHRERASHERLVSLLQTRVWIKESRQRNQQPGNWVQRKTEQTYLMNSKKTLTLPKVSSAARFTVQNSVCWLH